MWTSYLTVTSQEEQLYHVFLLLRLHFYQPNGDSLFRLNSPTCYQRRLAAYLRCTQRGGKGRNVKGGF